MRARRDGVQVLFSAALIRRCMHQRCVCCRVLQVVWAQLLAEPASRLDACITPGKDTQLAIRCAAAQQCWRAPAFGLACQDACVC